MIDPKRLRQDESIIKALESKKCPKALLDAFKQHDKKWRDCLQEVEKLKHEQKQVMPKGKPTQEQLDQLKEISYRVKTKEQALQVLDLAVKESALILPNIPLADVPIGPDESANVVCRVEGQLPSFDFLPKPHEEIGEALGILDFESAAHVTGARFVNYKGLGAKLERGLINFMLDRHSSQHGYTEVMPPVIVHAHSLQGTGQLPKFADDCFKIEDTSYWLSPTAEVQLTNMYRQSIIDESELPISMTAYTPCFRKEAGSYGRDVKGLIRLHQFNKVELVKLVKPEKSEEELQLLLSHAEAILKALGLSYRVVLLATGDLGFSAAKTYDLEVWMPSQNCYREISSCSTFLDFQARRAMIRGKNKVTDTVRYLHTLNGSGVAVGRAFAAILEVYQQSDGSVSVPEVLRPYVGVDFLR